MKGSFEPLRGHEPQLRTTVLERYTNLSHAVLKVDCLFCRALLWNSESICRVYIYVHTTEAADPIVRGMIFYNTF